MQARRLRTLHPVLAFQLLAGPLVAHLLTRPLAEPLMGPIESQQDVIDQIVNAWLRAMAVEHAPMPNPPDVLAGLIPDSQLTTTC